MVLKFQVVVKTVCSQVARDEAPIVLLTCLGHFVFVNPSAFNNAFGLDVDSEGCSSSFLAFDIH